MMIRLVTNKYTNHWLELAKEVEPLFGKMVGCEEFTKGIRELIFSKSAFCILHNNKDVGGIIAVDKCKNEIVWFAVKEKYRSKGYGYQLIKTAIEHLNKSKPIYVQTFSSSITEGGAARHLYEQFGFIDYKEAGKNPAGIDTVIMRFDSAKK